MKCNLCPQEIIINQQAFVIEEEPLPYPGHSLVTFAAHQECYAPYSNTNPAQVFTWGSGFERII